MMKMNDLLVRCGASISEINIVRKHLSRIKGGQLARLVYPATLVNLIVSDVPGDSPAVIASGPAYPDDSTFAEAMNIVERYNITEKMPESLLRHLKKGLEEKSLKTLTQATLFSRGRLTSSLEITEWLLKLPRPEQKKRAVIV